VSAAMSYARNDKLLAALSAYASEVTLALDAATTRRVEHAVMDTLAVALGALRHPAVKPALAYARNSELATGATLWGSRLRVTAETAALVNGVPLRGYDYNDLYIGKSGGHPSDIIPGLMALAEIRKVAGPAFLGAIALGYEVNMMMLDAIDVDTKHWDYPNITAIGATCAAARMIGLSREQTAEALAIAVISHFATDEVESGDLNGRGDLTMWKRFNGSHAIRHAIYAVLLAEAGVEGAVRPFEGASGFLSKVTTSPELIEQLLERLEARSAPGRISETQFKRWPVGSRGQSAIQAALQARSDVSNLAGVQAVNVRCDKEVYDHLLGRRADPWHPISRETADHSLPYIVATAVLDGGINADSFAPEFVRAPLRLAFLNEKVKVESAPELSLGASGGFLASVEIVDEAGKRHLGHAQPPPGHARQPFTDAEFEAKFTENVLPVFGAVRTAGLVQAIRSIAATADMSSFAARLAQDDVSAGSAHGVA
jgi:2-methylcitrate dehydratase